MANREEKRNLETIPVGSLGIISLPGCKPLGEKVDQYLVKWRAERESEHKESLAFAGYQRDSYLLDAKVPRFGSGGAKGQATEIQIAAENILKTKKKLNEILAANTGKPYDVIAADTERDHYMSAQEAMEYGLIDNVITSR